MIRGKEEGRLTTYYPLKCWSTLGSAGFACTRLTTFGGSSLSPHPVENVCDDISIFLKMKKEMCELNYLANYDNKRWVEK